MVVVADTSPVNYLVLIGQIEILPRLYTRILIPPAVLDELKHPLAPEPVRNWAAQPPGWLEVLTPIGRVDVAPLAKARRLLSQPRCMLTCCSSMSRQDGRKQYAAD